MNITSEQLVKLGAKKEDAYLKYGEALAEAMERFQINTPERISHFLAQVFHESGALSITNENLNYSAERLVAVYPKRFKTIEEAKPFQRNKKALSELLYQGFHGRGLIQLTHKYNYEECGKALGVDFINNKELLEQPKYACLSACWFWDKHKLNKLADIGGEGRVQTITKIINGGYNGLEDRIKYYRKAKEIFK